MKKDIIVVPNSKKEQILDEEPMRVKIKEKPEDNKANLGVERILSKYFGKKVRIVKGFKSKRKVVEID
ncbi:MAG: DUF167 domain-containing protein [Candidatus Aenigmarchaeota archaeon]|nr:DUF167 domain-containing protein [Candidatus Aenigmarchaeota archaeon]